MLPDFQDFHIGSVYFTTKVLAATDQLELLIVRPVEYSVTCSALHPWPLTIFYYNTNITTVLPDFQDFHIGSVYFTAKMLAATDQLELLIVPPVEYSVT